MHIMYQIMLIIFSRDSRTKSEIVLFKDISKSTLLYFWLLRGQDNANDYVLKNLMFKFCNITFS